MAWWSHSRKGGLDQGGGRSWARMYETELPKIQIWHFKTESANFRKTGLVKEVVLSAAALIKIKLKITSHHKLTTVIVLLAITATNTIEQMSKNDLKIHSVTITLMHWQSSHKRHSIYTKTTLNSIKSAFSKIHNLIWHIHPIHKDKLTDIQQTTEH